MFKVTAFRCPDGRTVEWTTSDGRAAEFLATTLRGSEDWTDVRSMEMSGPLLVIVESPYAGDVEANVEYARRCLRDSLDRGEAPLASHLLYTQPGVLRDGVKEERQRGVDAGLAWGRAAQATVVYADRGVSEGMRLGIERARKERRMIETRTIGVA